MYSKSRSIRFKQYIIKRLKYTQSEIQLFKATPAKNLIENQDLANKQQSININDFLKSETNLMMNSFPMGIDKKKKQTLPNLKEDNQKIKNERQKQRLKFRLTKSEFAQNSCKKLLDLGNLKELGINKKYLSYRPKQEKKNIEREKHHTIDCNKNKTNLKYTLQSTLRYKRRTNIQTQRVQRQKIKNYQSASQPRKFNLVKITIPSLRKNSTLCPWQIDLSPY